MTLKKMQAEFAAVTESGVNVPDKALALDRSLSDVLDRLKVVVPGTRFSGGDAAAGEPASKADDLDLEEEEKERREILNTTISRTWTLRETG